MIKLICSRCKKETEIDRDEVYEARQIISDKSYDLCLQCRVDYDKFIKLLEAKRQFMLEDWVNNREIKK